MKKLFFTLFLVVYLFFILLPHAMHEISFIMFTGIGLAIYSHTCKGPLAPSLLLLHMGVEWLEWLHNPASFLAWLGRIGHSVMDITFYHHEISAHRRKKYWLWSGTTFLLIFISSSFIFKIPEQILELLHQFSLGGAIGCVSSHIFYHIFKEKPNYS